MENNQFLIKANTQKSNFKNAFIITGFCLIFVCIILVWGLKLGYYSYSSVGTGTDIPWGELNVNYKPDKTYIEVNWFGLSLYEYDSAYDLPRPEDTLLGMPINPNIYIEFDMYYKDHIFWLAIVCILIIAIPFAAYFIHCKMCKNTSLTITDTQATGSYSSFLSKKSVQLPLDKINNLTITNSFMDKLRGGKTLGLATASGVIKMHFIGNAEEIVSCFTTLISNSHGMETPVPVPSEQAQTTSDKLEELLKLKNSGLITEEEYAHKREDILSKL